MISFNGELYYDDRLYVLYVCKCTVSPVDDDMLETIIHHESAPANHRWCIATYRNVKGYSLVRVDHFDSYDEARLYLEKTEPTVPLASLNGSPPASPMPYPEFSEWKSMKTASLTTTTAAFIRQVDLMPWR